VSGADLLLYRRMRGVFWGLLLVGVIVLPIMLALGIAIAAQLELFPEDAMDEAGRPSGVFAAGFGVAGLVASIAAVVLGATAGSVDLQRGVLRDLVLAGRTRVRIVLGRLAAAAAWLLLAIVISFGLTILIGVLLAPISGVDDWGEVARDGARYLVSVAYALPFAAGVALLIGSRGPAIAVYFAVTFLIDGVISIIPKLGDYWQHVSLIRADQQVVQWLLEEPVPYDWPVWQSALVLVGWAVIPLAAGLVRLTRRDL
jgi:ABC-type transport system involved in multi-copper enzyme maturation permease subunit